MDEYRGFRIERIGRTIQTGHAAAGARRKTRDIGTQYLIHLEDGGTKVVSTMRAAREYVDSYLGSEHITPNSAMTFEEAKRIKQRLEAEVSEYSDVLNGFPKGPTGITPDSVRATAEWRAANAGFQRSFQALRSFNEKYVKEFRAELAAERRSRRGQVPNASQVYYVWLLDYSNVPIDTEGPYGPRTLKSAESFARIGAQNGDHDRAVSHGLNPEAETFEIVRRYRRGTGERIL